MNNVQIFKNAEFGEVRTVVISNEPWFVGKDVSGILGYSDTNKAIAMHVDGEDKKTQRQNVVEFRTTRGDAHQRKRIIQFDSVF